MSRSFSELSCRLTKTISKDIKKNNGIYFTPPETVQKTLDIISEYKQYNQRWNGEVLEPSCGSCEYVLGLKARFPSVRVTAIEYNKEIYEAIKDLSGDNSDNIYILNTDFLTYETDKKYDLIIGNPPYYVIKKEKVCEQFYKYFDGRPNIFVIFLMKSLEMLNDNGILSFVLPKNFLNCIYYDKARAYIAKQFKIVSITQCNDKYLETQQDTILFIVQKALGCNDRYVMKINEYTIFGDYDNIEALKKLYEGSCSLADMGFKVNVGTVDILTDDSSKTRLIYSSDIKNAKLIMKTYSNKNKKNFIMKQGTKQTILVINRGYGVGDYKFEYCLINGNENDHCEYLVENHLICIKYAENIERNRLIDLYKTIIKSLDDHRTLEFIKLYFGNNAINTTELNYILPIYTTTGYILS
jgi:tRNA1(Val) A37 N6-methylase TrmN6